MNTTEFSNRLVHATSPYLLQHAHNPVDWYEWGPEALDKSKKENKPILVSIGYSSCHWCHVMERESFENKDIADIMNEFFVCIKVDREERPDIDHIYMEAVQAMGTHGGWPLNVFLTPEQKPFYGGTYFPPQNWAQLLSNINKVFTSRRHEIEDSAEKLRQQLSQNDVERFRTQANETELRSDLEKIYTRLESAFDTTQGGLDKAPKFVMPSVWLCLLRYYHITKNQKALDHTLFTLKCIARGGIYDQVGGGFARYSVDAHWFAPHFEKMLYDNAQLTSLYAEAYALTGDDEFKIIVNETYDWLLREMTSKDGGFYSALDADSEGVEGKFYVWKKSEIETVLGTGADMISNYYSVRQEGNWEHGSNILNRNKPDDEFLKEHNLTAESWSATLKAANKKLLEERDKRPRPGLDDKVLTSWNGLMVCGLVDAFKAFGDEKFLSAAIKNMQFLKENLTDKNILYRSFKIKRSATKGFLDDYAYVIQACLKLYEVTFDETWIQQAEGLLNYTLANFYDASDGYFHYSDKDAEKLIATRKEIFDNVIPSSNSLMAMNLLHMGILLDHEKWKEIASAMTRPLSNLICSEPNYMSNWAMVLIAIKKGLAEVVMAGQGIETLRRAFHRHYEPFSITMGKEGKGELPLVKDKEPLNGTPTIYVCFNKTCKLPVHSVSEAVKQLAGMEQAVAEKPPHTP